MSKHEKATQSGSTAAPQIEICATESLVPYARNPRKNDHAIDRMAASIREWGFKIPILARNNGEVVDGHLRLKAAQKLALTEVPVIWCDEWTPTQVKAFRLLVNRSASWADWDDELLTLELLDLKAADIDLAITGFDPAELDDLLFRPHSDEASAGVIPEIPTQAVTRPGDLWICAEHRILCGDATRADDVTRVIGSLMPVLMLTDPPYGVDYNPLWRQQAGLGQQRQTGRVVNDDRVDWTPAYRLYSGDVAYVWHAGVHTVEAAASLQLADFEIRSQLVWIKQNFVLSRGNYHWQHEPCWYAVRKGRTANWCGDRTQSTVWPAANLNPFGGDREEATGHGTQKPLELMKRPILNHTQCGQCVYEPFLGSGTVLIACELTQRVCCGLEIDPRYVDMSISRWQTVTNREAVLHGTAYTFDQVRAQRLGGGSESMVASMVSGIEAQRAEE
jgi:DNA modification methylase